MHFFVGLKWVLQRLAQVISLIREIFKAFWSTRLKPWVEALVHHSRLHNLLAKFFLKKFDFFFILDARSSYLLTFQDAACQVYFLLCIRINKRKRALNIRRLVLNNLLLVCGLLFLFKVCCGLFGNLLWGSDKVQRRIWHNVLYDVIVDVTHTFLECSCDLVCLVRLLVHVRGVNHAIVPLSDHSLSQFWAFLRNFVTEKDHW